MANKTVGPKVEWPYEIFGGVLGAAAIELKKAGVRGAEFNHAMHNISVVSMPKTETIGNWPFPFQKAQG